VSRTGIGPVDAERAFWDAQAADGIASARRAVWAEPDDRYLAGTALCLIEVSDVLGPVLEAGGLVLDLGCGLGRLSNPLARVYRAGRIVGVDISSRMLAHARAQAQWENLTVLYLRGDGRGLPFPGPIDGAYSVLLFQHLPAEAVEGYIHAVATRLRKGAPFRFQFAEHDDDLFLSHGHAAPVVARWCDEAGMWVRTVDRGASVYPTWTWVTAIKR
jgi:SAM-dependent methyltransferase